MKKFLTTAAAVGAALGTQAATLTYIQSFGPVNTDFTGINAATVTLPKFDSSLGTLAQVSYELKATVSTTGFADSENAQATVVTLNFAATVNLEDATLSNVLLSLTPSDTSGPIPLGPDSDFPPDFTGSDSVTFPNVLLDSASGVAANPLDWVAAFLGETIDLKIVGIGTSQATGSANSASFFSQAVAGEVSVTYEYSDVVPETSTYLSMFGLLGVAGIAGRRLVRR